MYDSTKSLSVSLLGALLFGHKAAAAEPSITASSFSTSFSTMVSGQDGTLTAAAASSTIGDIADEQGWLYTVSPDDLGVSSLVCASWLDPDSHSTIYERCFAGKPCKLMAFPKDVAASDDYDLTSLVGCDYPTAGVVTLMYPHQGAPSSGCWESGWGCCSENDPYNIVLTIAEDQVAMYACATRDYGSLPVLGFEWHTSTTISRKTPSSAAATSSITPASSTGVSMTPGSGPNAGASPTVSPNTSQTTQEAASRGLGGKSRAEIAVGSIICGGALLVFAVVMLWRYRKRRREQQQPESSFGGLEKADDDGNGDNPCGTGQAAKSMLRAHLASELDAGDTARRVSEIRGVGKTAFTRSSPGRTELAGSSPTSAELPGSPAISLSRNGSESLGLPDSPILPHDPSGSLPVSTSSSTSHPHGSGQHTRGAKRREQPSQQ